MKKTLLSLVTLMVLLPWVGNAQMMLPSTSVEAVVEEPLDPSPNDVRELSRLLTDPTIIGWLQQRAETENVDDSSLPERTFKEVLRESLERVESRIADVGTALATLPDTPSVVTANWKERIAPSDRLAMVNLMLIFLFTGIGLEWLYWRYAVRLNRWAEVRHQAQLGTKTVAIVVRGLLISCGVLVFKIGTLGTFVALTWPPFVENLVLSGLFFFVALRMAIGFCTFVYAPHDDSLRLVRLKRRSARMMSFGVVGVVAMLAGSGSLSALSLLLGAEPTAGLGIEIVGAFLAMLIGIGLFWVIHIRTDASLKHLTIVITSLATVIFSLIFITWLVGATRMATSLFVLAMLGYFGGLLRHGIRSAFAIVGDDDPEEKESRENMLGIYQPVAERLGRFVVISIGIVSLASIWGLAPWNPAQSSTAVDKFVSIGVDIFAAWLIGDLIWTLTRTVIDRKMSGMPKLEHGQMPGPEARMATLLPLFKKIVAFTVIAMVVLITLASMGINIAPILAGAGVVGLAIGFGAQALVRDIVSGVFFLIDDAFRVGEYIEMGELRGTVESISIRSLRVRHHRGAVHTIPFGELKSLTNYSRDWVMMKLEFRVPFETDLKLAKKLVKKIDAQLQANPDYGNNFLQPLKFQGVRRMEEFNMVVGVKFMTKPGDQWTIRRDAYQGIRDEFEKAGINFAQRNVKVEVIGKGEITEDEKRQALGAAQDAIEQQVGA